MIDTVLRGLPDDVLDAAFPEPLFGPMVSTWMTLIHLNGHLNYHLGQIDYLRRVSTGDGAIALASV
jgi:hypothetical protein